MSYYIMQVVTVQREFRIEIGSIYRFVSSRKSMRVCVSPKEEA